MTSEDSWVSSQVKEWIGESRLLRRRNGVRRLGDGASARPRTSMEGLKPCLLADRPAVRRDHRVLGPRCTLWCR